MKLHPSYYIFYEQYYIFYMEKVKYLRPSSKVHLCQHSKPEHHTQQLTAEVLAHLCYDYNNL